MYRRTVIGAAVGGGLAGCLDRNGAPTNGTQNSADDAAVITNPDGEASVSVALEQRIGFSEPDDYDLTLTVSRVAFDAADGRTIALEVDESVELWRRPDERRFEAAQVLEEAPLPAETYEGLRVYGDVSDVRIADVANPTVELSRGNAVERTFGSVFEPGDLTEFTLHTGLEETDNGYEIAFNGMATVSW